MKSLKSRSLKPPAPQPLQAHLQNYLQANFSVDAKLKLALSGGLDSAVLLHLLATTWPILQLSAAHVHHGLSEFADHWAGFCTELCAQYQIPLTIINVSVPTDSGLGVEATARALRYDALLQGDFDAVITAHHQDDQAETLLLQLFRGAGVKGLSAMAAMDIKRKIARPLLDIPRADLLKYAQQNKLNWIEDDSNQNIYFERNFLRLTVIPALLERYQALNKTLARSANHLAEAAQMLDELAELDAGLEPVLSANVAIEPVNNESAAITEFLVPTVVVSPLSLLRLSQLSESRAKNCLRWWLSKQLYTMPSTGRLDEILSQLINAKTDAQVKLILDNKKNMVIRRYQNMAYIVEDSIAEPYAISWQGEAVLQLPDQTQLIFVQKLGVGLALNRLQINKLRITNRQGGEEFKPEMNRPTRTLKHCLQAANIPPWLRVKLPLIYCQDDLAIVPSVGCASHLQARFDEMGLDVVWSGFNHANQPNNIDI